MSPAAGNVTAMPNHFAVCLITATSRKSLGWGGL